MEKWIKWKKNQNKFYDVVVYVEYKPETDVKSWLDLNRVHLAGLWKGIGCHKLCDGWDA